MPRSRNSAGAPMTWARALPILAVAFVFDALKFLFNQFWFFGPALAALYCTSKVSDVVGTTIAGGLCSGLAAMTGLLSAGALEVFGVVMAMATALAGWLIIGLWIVMTNRALFKANATGSLWFSASLLVGEIPIVGTVPAMTVALWKLYRTQIKKEQAELVQAGAQREAGAAIY